MSTEEERLRALLAWVLDECEAELSRLALAGAARSHLAAVREKVRDELHPARVAGEHERGRY